MRDFFETVFIVGTATLIVVSVIEVIRVLVMVR